MRSGLSKVFKGKNVLITGGMGFIGSNLAEKLVGMGAKLLLVDSMVPQYGGNLFNIEPIKDKVRINISDVRDETSMRYLVKDQDYLFNLAGTLSHIDSMVDPYTDLEINCRAQLSILEACRKNNPDIKVVFSGTRGEYGKVSSLPVTEDHPLNPTDVNGINNIAGEMCHILYNNIYHIRSVSLRLTNVYGPRHQMRHSRQGFLNWFVRCAIDNETIRIYGDGSQLRDFNYIDDVVDALLMVAANDKSYGRIYNLGSGSPISVADVAKMVVKSVGKGRLEVVPYPEDLKPVEVGDYYADITRIRTEIGWTPKTGMEDGLRKTVAYFKKHRRHYWDENDR